MNKQHLFILLFLYPYIIQITSGKNAHSNTSKNKLILKMNGEFILLNPTNRNTLTTYGLTDKDRNIIYLKITNKKFIPPDIFRLKYLKVLEIQNTCFYPCERQQIPSDIERLRSLIELTINNTKITHLPEQIGKLKKLEILIVSNTGLMSLPDSIGNLTSLVVINLVNNNLTTLPKTMKNLEKLKRIFLTNNSQLQSIESLNGLSSLETLDAQHCSIEVLPHNLPLLSDLHMSDNKLTTLYGIETLGYEIDMIKSFYFNKNLIYFVPPEIDQVENLDTLNLNDNRLVYMPLNICRIPTLQHLSIFDKSLNGVEIQKFCYMHRNSNQKFP